MLGLLMLVGLCNAGLRIFSARQRSALDAALARYEGDGEIADTSFPWFAGLWVLGYEVRFDRFPLDEPFEATYTLAPGELPTRISDRWTFYLSIAGESGRLLEGKGSVNASFALRVTESDGDVLIDLDRPLRSCVWSVSGGSIGIWTQEGQLQPRAGERYLLSVRYTPSPRPGPIGRRVGFFHVECGGSL